jgi:hypothetical protein
LTKFPASVRFNQAMKYLITFLLLFVGHTLRSQPFQHRGTHEYKIFSKVNDSTSTECGGYIKIKMTGKTRYFDFARGYITIQTCDFKLKERFVALPYYKGLEFFDIGIKEPDLRIVMFEGLFGFYTKDTLITFYDSTKIIKTKK